MKTLLSLCVSALLLSACSKKADDVIQNAREAAKDKDLQEKTFVSECSATPIEALLTGLFTLFKASVKGQTTAYRVEGARITRTTTAYSAANCSGDPAFTFLEKGTVSINKDEKYRSNDGGYLIDFDFDKLSVSIGDDAGVKVADGIKLCGLADWTTKSDREVTQQSKDVNCYGSALPRHVSNRYKLDGNILYLGTPTKGETTDSQRPASLSTTRYTAK